MFTLAGIVGFIFFLVVAGAIFYLLNYVLDHANIPEPYKNVGKIVLLVASVFILIWALLALIGQAPPIIRGGPFFPEPVVRP